MKHTYIVCEVIVEETIGNEIPVGTVIRKVVAESVPEAIGKFVMETKDAGVKVQKRLGVNCYKLSDLKTIK